MSNLERKEMESFQPEERPIDVAGLLPARGEPWAPRGLRGWAQVPVIDLLSILVRLDQVAEEGVTVGAANGERIWTCDIPRLWPKIDEEGLAFMREHLPASWERLRTITFEPEKVHMVYPRLDLR